MFTKAKVKKYLNTIESFSFFDELLNFYTTIHMKEVLRFWGMKKIQFHLDFFEEEPILIKVHSTLNSLNCEIVFSVHSCTINYPPHQNIILNYNEYDSLNSLFEHLRILLEA